jgi:class 3 adenylate cyclase
LTEATASASPRLQDVAKPVGICLSDDAHRQVKSQLDPKVSDLRPTQLKNIARPIRIYSIEVRQPAKANPAPVASMAEKSDPREALEALKSELRRRY